MKRTAVFGLAIALLTPGLYVAILSSTLTGDIVNTIASPLSILLLVSWTISFAGWLVCWVLADRYEKTAWWNVLAIWWVVSLGSQWVLERVLHVRPRLDLGGETVEAWSLLHGPVLVVLFLIAALVRRSAGGSGAKADKTQGSGVQSE
jgi:hypothetical protein